VLNTQGTSKYAIVWFKRDLRLHDHAPLVAAVQSGLPVIALYVVEPDYWTLPDVSRRHWCFIRDCLTELDQRLQALGGRLIVRVGDSLNVLNHFRQQAGDFDLYSHEETGNDWTYRRDKEINRWCKENSVSWHESPSNGVVRRLNSRDAWQRLRDERMGQAVLTAPASVPTFDAIVTDPVPRKDNALFGDDFIGTVQDGGRVRGLDVLRSFLSERSRKYMQTISKPGVSARHCSRLSAHIAYGTLSVREIEQATKARIAELGSSTDAGVVSHKRNLRAFLSRLAWRCHFVQRLEQQPSIEFKCMHPAFEGMREPHHDEAKFEAWKAGRTGYPLVDASMRSLHENGWINFRMRAMLVSFASYDLWLDWRVTAPFLARLFTDYEPGIHYSQFQMQSGVTGMNAIRMYSPVKQSLDHDPEGKFIRRYVPELGDTSIQWIHEPWRQETPPSNYPAPIVDHAAVTAFARQEIAKRWKGDGFREAARAVNAKLGSRKRQPKRGAAKPKSNQLEFDL
jgi:deoxyribodipyrimidine photo-lyase